MVLSCQAPKHCEYGHKMASGSLGSARNPTFVSEIQLLRPFKTVQLHQAGGKNQEDRNNPASAARIILGSFSTRKRPLS